MENKLTREERIAMMQRRVDEGLASGLGKLRRDQIFAVAVAIVKARSEAERQP